MGVLLQRQTQDDIDGRSETLRLPVIVELEGAEREHAGLNSRRTQVRILFQQLWNGHNKR